MNIKQLIVDALFAILGMIWMSAYFIGLFISIIGPFIWLTTNQTLEGLGIIILFSVILWTIYFGLKPIVKKLEEKISPTIGD